MLTRRRRIFDNKSTKRQKEKRKQEQRRKDEHMNFDKGLRPHCPLDSKLEERQV